MPVVGTAGHVDHGKSTLVHTLTGRDPDRWSEEKERGLTIDLGFAWTTLPSGTEVGFVDVPGHERFIKNMLAGVEAVSVALFVVAADEGWMPQSEEHLAVLDLLGIGSGVIALTRADLVDADALELVTLEVDERLEGTSLEGSPIIPTAAPTGDGIDALTAALDSAVASTEALDRGRPRMWIDRAFSISGAGTVLTGTLMEGSMSLDDPVVVLPDRLEGRIRAIQTHERSVEHIGPGNRAAINVAGIERADVGRGAMLARPGDWALTRRFSAAIRAVRGIDSPIAERGSFHLHLGSAAWPARLRLIDGEPIEESGHVVLELAEPIPLRWRDRFILREVGRQAVVAGGRVLDPDPPRRLRDVARTSDVIAAADDADAAADALLAGRGVVATRTLEQETGGGVPPDGIPVGATWYHPSHLAGIVTRAEQIVDEFHDQSPLRAGIPKARLAEQLGIPVDGLDGLLERAVGLEPVGADVRRVGFGVSLEAADQAAWEAARSTLESAGFGPPRRADLGLTREVEHALLRRGDLVEVAPDLLYLPKTLDDIVATTRTIPDGFTVADFRDALGITRKHAVPLVEWMDASGITRRDGDVRRVL